jgi:Mrp family chromosome partitioning ATPase
MTRLFDALKKAQATLAPVFVPAAAPQAPLPPLAAPAAPPRGAASRSASGRASERTPEPASDARMRIVPFESKVTLPEELQREMTALRVNLEAAIQDRTPRLVTFLSAQGGEGTSSVALQFAISLSNDPRLRTLLVDAHARRPAPWLKAATAAVHPLRPQAPAPGDAGRRLDLLPLDERQARAGVLSIAEVRAALEAVSEGYDWIVVDSPPVLDSPDAAPLSSLVDGAVVVVQAGRTKRPVLARAVELIRKSGGHVLGSVLNRRRMEIPEFIYRRI